MVKDDTAVAQWDNTTGLIKFADASAAIFLRAIGGKGGCGGDGGAGGIARAGASGRNATRCTNGTDGERGGPGGAGGHGGAGGNGGKGGDIKVYVSPEDSDLLMLLKTPDASGGAKGRGGHKGKGKPGGNGGPGGIAYSWSEVKYEYHQVYHAFRSMAHRVRSELVSGINPWILRSLGGLMAKMEDQAMKG